MPNVSNLRNERLGYFMGVQERASLAGTLEKFAQDTSP